MFICVKVMYVVYNKNIRVYLKLTTAHDKNREEYLKRVTWECG